MALSLLKGLTTFVPMGTNYAQSATVVSDRTPVGNNMTVNGSPTINTSNTAFTSGTSDYLEFDSAVAYTGTKTIAIDFYVTTISTTQVFLYFYAGAADYLTFGMSTSKLLASAANSAAASSISSTLQSATWYTAVVTKTAGDITNIYINGSDDTNATAAKWINDTTKYIVGASWYGGHYAAGFNGKLRNLAVWNRALSSTEAALWSDRHYLSKIGFKAG